MAIVDFTYAQVEDGFSGFFDPNTAAGAGYLGFSIRAVWAGVITGTEASFEIACGGSNPPLGVVVDGSYVGTPALSSGRVQLFTGLSDTPHLVSIHIVGGYAPKYNWVDESSTAIVRVDGAVPAVTVVPVTIPTDPSANILNSQPKLDWDGDNEDLIPSEWGHPDGNTKAMGQVIFNAQCSDIYIYASSQVFFYSVDGGTPTRVTLTGYDNSQARLLPLATGLDDTAVHKYRIWQDVSSGDTSYIHGVAAFDDGVPVALSPISPLPFIIQFGNSITAGEGESSGYVDIWLVGNENDYLVAQCGVTGDLSWSPSWPSVGSLADRIPLYMAEMETPDYALLASGRNDDLDVQATFETGYDNLCDAVVAAGMVAICRGQLPGTASSGAIANAEAWIQNVISGFSGFLFLDTSDFTPAATADGLHPTAAGYATIADDEAPAMAALIPSEPASSVSLGPFWKTFGSWLGVI